MFADNNIIFPRYKELYEKYGELPAIGDIKLGGTDETITLKLCVPEKGVEVEKSFSIYDTVSGALGEGGGGGTTPLPTFCLVFIKYRVPLRCLSLVCSSVFYLCTSWIRISSWSDKKHQNTNKD